MEMTIQQAAQLRKLRLWHWLEMRAIDVEGMECDRSLRSNWGDGYGADRVRARMRDLRAKRAFHLGAVQVLNDFFPMGETAEKDELAGMKP